MKHRTKRRRRGNAGAILFPLFLLLFLIVLSMGIAWLWHLLSGDAAAAALPEQSSSSWEMPTPLPTPAPTVRPRPTPTPSEAPSGADAPQDDLPQYKNTPAAAVQQSAAVDDSYFDDAVFVGDSITDGIRAYGVMQNTTVLAGTGVGLDNYFTRGVIKQEDGTRITIPEALAKEDPAKVYLMLGPNALGFAPDTFRSYYGKVVASVKELCPDSIIYVQSMLPATSKVAEVYPTVSNEKINEYNRFIEAIAAEHGVNYLYVHEALADENGELPLEASPKDGLHFGKSSYEKWFDYLRTHTVKE